MIANLPEGSKGDGGLVGVIVCPYCQEQLLCEQGKYLKHECMYEGETNWYAITLEVHLEEQDEKRD